MVIMTSARHVQDFQVEVGFDDGKTFIVDLADYLNGPVFEVLRSNPKLFQSMRFDHDVETIVWPNGADLSPEFLYQLGSTKN